MALIRRRQLLIAAGAAGVAFAARAQETARVYRIGFVSPFAPAPSIKAFRQGLRELGYVEGKNLVLEQRYAEGKIERLPGLFAELLRLKIDVLMVGSTPGAIAAKKEVTTIPVVFGGVWDPVGAGIVASLARPGGNITGASNAVGGLGFTGKCLELLKEVAPGLSLVAVLLGSHPLSAQFAGEVQLAARPLNLKSEVFDATSAVGLEKALAAIGASGAHGIFVAPDPFLTASSDAIARFALSRRLPALHFSSRYADAGGLMSYGASLDDSYRRAARHVDRILKGANPAELPVDQPTTFELVINLKSARAMGLTIPRSMLLRADRVIE
jgi:putative ABC transport system substrate-binding protein